MERQEGSGHVPKWENMNKDMLSNIFKKLDVVDIIMGASRVCITWFLASHNKTIWNTIKLNDLDSIILDCPCGHDVQDNDREKHRYHLREILIEINKFGRAAPVNFFFNLHSSILEEDLAVISKGFPNIRKLALPTWNVLNLDSVQSAFSKWKNLQTLIIYQYIEVDDFNLQLKAIGDNCRNLTAMKLAYELVEDLATTIVCNFPNLERLSFRCTYLCTEAAMSLIIGLPYLKSLNLSHCIFTKRLHLSNMNIDLVVGMKPKEELVNMGTQKLENFMVCCSECTICQDVRKYRETEQYSVVEYYDFWDKQWKTDEIKAFEF